MSVPVAGLKLFPPGAGAGKLRSKALKAGFPFRKLWILESKLEEEAEPSGSPLRSMSRCRAWTRAEALLEVCWGAEETDEGTESDGL